MTTLLEYFEKQVKQHTESLDSRTKDTALVWDLWCALQELSKEHDILREAYGRLMRGVEEKINPARWPVVETPPPLMREPAQEATERERERCAKIAERISDEFPGMNDIGRAIEAAIRQPALGPLGMGSAEGIKDQDGIKVWKAMHDGLRAEYPDLPDLTPIMQGDKLNITVLGDCGKVHPTFEDWQHCEQCEAAIKSANVSRVVPEWLVSAVDKLRDDYKDGNYFRSKRAAADLLMSIDAAGYAIVPKPERKP